MREQLKRLTSDSAVYGISTILGRFLNFLLVPLYTNVFPAGEYGVVTVVYSYVAFLNFVYPLGLEAAFMRFVSNASDEEARNAVFSAPVLLIALASAAFTALLLLFSEPIAVSSNIRGQWGAIIPLASITLALDAINVVPFAALRMERKARRFAFIRVTNILINIALNLVFVLVLHMSIVSIFTANLVASASSTLLLAPGVFARLRFSFPRRLLRDMLVFGVPTIPAGLAAMVTQVINRPIMQAIMGDEATGIFGANYRLGIIMMLVVTMFQYAWQPFFLQMAGRDDARRLFARVMTYFMLLGSAIVLGVSFFIDDAATVPLLHGRSLIGRGYWSGLPIVPVVLFGYLWTGVSTILNAGLLIEKRTGHLALVTGIGAAVNVAANLLLIPPYGLMGAAYAMLAAYLVMALLYWILSQRIYPVAWEYARLARIILALAAVAALWYLPIKPAVLPQLAWEAVLLVLYIVLLFVFRFFLPSELRELRGLLRAPRTFGKTVTKEQP